MKFELLLVYIICITHATSFPCGPDGLCQCQQINVMDCSDNSHLGLRKVCDFIQDSKTANVTVLHLERNGYSKLVTEDLRGCSSLNSLYLRGNEITNVNKFSLAYLYHLMMLDLSYNKLDVYNKTGKLGFALPLLLKGLVLSGNLHFSGHDDAMYPDLSHLSNIEQLTIDGLKNKNFPTSYRQLQSLRSVSVSGLDGHCSITHVSNATFQNLIHIKVLNLSSCDIQYIEAGAFKALHKLEVLDLTKNMNLGFCNLQNVTYSLQFTNIKSLNFSKVYTTFGLGTQIKLQDVCYLWNTNLTELVLNDNRINLIETNILILTPITLKILRAENNKFTFGPYLYQLGCLSSMEQFYGNFQNLASDPKQYMKEPKEYIQHCIPTFTCPYAESHILINISKMKGDQCPYFKDNYINMTTTLPTFPKRTKRLEFSRCGLEYNVTSLLLLPNSNDLEYLDGSGNILYSWIGPVGPFPSVKYLNLSRNYCSHIGLKFFDGFKSVEDLQIQENFLGLVLSNDHYGPFIFEKLLNLKVLNLSSNIISNLHPTFISNMVNLTTLDLSFNNIESLTFDVSSLHSLLYLHLKFNFIRSIPSLLRDKLEVNSRYLHKQFTIDLSNNTLSVSCDEKEFLKWLVKHRNNMLNFDYYTFLNKSGQSVSAEVFVKDVMKLDMDCRSYIAIIVACSIGISIFLSVVIGGVVYKNRWKLRYLMRMTKIRHFGYAKLQQYFYVPERFMYDAFISYAGEDLRFILDRILPQLEEQNLKLCLHDRDFVPGNNIADNILQAIGRSRKTVTIISKQFLKSKWCLFEFNMARMESIYSRDGNNCLIIVILEDVSTRNMSNEMLDWMRCNTYIEYTTEAEGEEVFWDNLFHALNE